MKKYLYLLMAMLCILIVLGLIILVPDINFNIFMPILVKKISFNISQYSLIVWILGLLGGINFALFYITQRNAIIKSYEKRYEKMSVKKDEDESKVKVLESKIKTLEKALEKALKKE